MIYAGIGSRETPTDILTKMTALAAQMAALGWLLRSGAADGADRAWEQGCDSAGGRKEIWLPWARFNGSSSSFWLRPNTPQMTKAKEIAASVHPAWDRCNEAVRRLHARNVVVVLGADFETPVDRVIAWTPNGAAVGGSATALNLAQSHSIEVVNLAVREVEVV